MALPKDPAGPDPMTPNNIACCRTIRARPYGLLNGRESRHERRLEYPEIGIR